MDEMPLSILRYSVLLFGVVATKIPASIYDVIPLVRQSQRHRNTFNSFSCKTEYFKNSFFPCVVVKWKKPNPKICSSGSFIKL